MPTDITKTLRKALAELQAEKAKIDRQIAAIEGALAALDARGVRRGKGTGPGRRPARKPMSAAQRKAVGKRMKAYWAKQKAEAKKSDGGK